METKHKSSNTTELNEYELFALAKRLNFGIPELKKITFITLINTLLASVDENVKTQEATEEDINAFFR